jgi:hypothetical protein
MNTRNLPGGKGRPARKADNLTAICEPIVYKMWEPQHLTTLWSSTVCCRDNFALTFYTVISFILIRNIYVITFFIYLYFHVFCLLGLSFASLIRIITLDDLSPPN